MSILRILRWLVVSRFARRLARLLIGLFRRIGWRRVAHVALRLITRRKQTHRFGFTRLRGG